MLDTSLSFGVVGGVGKDVDGRVKASSFACAFPFFVFFLLEEGRLDDEPARADGPLPIDIILALLDVMAKERLRGERRQVFD